MAAVTLQGLGYRYANALEDTLTGLDLEIGNGEAHALLGGSGAGKTTLLNLLSGLLQPTAGDIRFAGESVANVPAAMRGVAQVFQFPVLYDSLNLLDNLGFPLRTRGVGARARRTRAMAVAELLDFADNGMADLAGLRPKDLSLYQKQLLAIGKALVRPDVALVLLDEPLTAVQPSLKWALRRTLRQVQQELGVTMVYVTHDQTEALTFAERVSVLRDGAIVQCATPEQLYLRPEHAYVGYFIGSPGMNFIPAEVRAGQLLRGVQHWPLPAGIEDGPVQIGFRPEWVRIAGAPQLVASDDGVMASSAAPVLNLTGVMARCRVTGFADRQRLGLMQLDLPEPVEVSGPLQHEPGAAVELLVTRALLFRAQRLLAVVSQGELAAPCATQC